MTSRTGRYDGPADPSTPCDECGGPTYTFESGSIWCPSEDGHAEKGSRFVLRVFFERRPKSLAEAIERTKGKPRSEPITRRVTAVAKAKAKPAIGDAIGYDSFVRSE